MPSERQPPADGVEPLPPRRVKQKPPDAFDPREDPDAATRAKLERRRERKLRRRKSLRLVRTGLTLVLAGLILVILVALAGFILGLLDLSPETELQAVRYLAMTAVTANVLSIAGRVCCLVVPPQSGARPYIYGAVGLDLLSGALSIGFVAGVLPEWVTTISGLASVAALVLFVLFLLRLAVYLKIHEAAKEAEELLGWGVWLVISLAALRYVLPWIPILGWVVAFFLSIAVYVLFIVMVVRYAGLLWWLRSSIE